MAVIDAVLFDFGGVFTGSPFAALLEYAGRLPVPPEAVLQQVFGDYSADGDHAWHRLERGQMSLADARQAILDSSQRDLGLAVDLYEILMAMASAPVGGVREPVVDCVRAIRRQGLPTAIVTNNVREFKDAWRGMLPVDELFDAVIDSSEVGVRKPNTEIYRLALEAVGSAPERAVFLDDLEPNVQAARNLGMHGIRVDEDFHAALRQLDALLDGR